MIDCPWPYEAWGKNGHAKSGEAHYPTMSLEEIAALPVRELLGRRGLLWVWMTWPLIAAQSNIAQHSWGLRPVTGGSWNKRTKNGKLRLGTGKVLRSVSEPFMLFTTHGATFRSTTLRTLIDHVGRAGVDLDGLARRHSQKPVEAYEMVEALVPGGKLCDVFSRTDRPRWEAFGDQAGIFNRDGHRE